MDEAKDPAENAPPVAAGGAQRRASHYTVTGGSGNQTFEFVNPLLKLGITSDMKNDRMNKMGGAKQITDFLASVSSFADFDAQQLHKLESNAVIRSYAEGQVVFLQGEPGAEFFVIHSGAVDVLIQTDKSAVAGMKESKEYGKVVNRLNEGSYFGERALMTSEPRAATIRAATAICCYVFSRRIYEEVINGVVGVTEAVIDLSKDHETRSLFKHITTILDIQRMANVSPEVRRTFYALTTTFTPELSADQIISRMVMIVKAAVAADRVGLFLLSEDKKMMVLKMSEISKGIRLPIKGLAGAVLQLNAVINAADAYLDERFDTTMDKRTGYRTHQVLGVPVRNPVTGEAVGVLQVNNRTDVDDGSFTESHVSILQLAANQFEELLQGRMDVFLNSDWWNGVSVSHSSEIERPFKIGLQRLVLGEVEQALVAKEGFTIYHVYMYLHLAVHEMCAPIRFEFKSTHTGDMVIDQTQDFDINVCNLPKSARIFFRVTGKKRKGAKSVHIGWAAGAVFDFKGCLNYNLELCLFHGKSDSLLTTSDSNVHDPQCSKMSVILGPDLSVLDKATQLPRVRIVHEAPVNEEPIGLDETPLEPSEEARLDELRKLSFNPVGMKAITEDMRAFVWNVRLQIANRPDLLPAFVMSIHWQNSEQVRELYDLLELWARPTPPVALQLLDRKFMDPVIRAYAVNCLEVLEDGELSLYMLQLCQQLKYEMFVDSALSRFLLRKALLNPRIIGHIFYWQLTSEVHNVDVKHRFERLLQLYIQNCGSHRTALGHQMFVMRKLEAIAHRVCQGESREDRLQILRSQLRTVADTLPSEFQLPLNPEITVTGIVVDKCRVMESKKKPLWLTFVNSEGKHYVIMLKVGDDLRQDALIMQLLRVMNDLWRREHLDMKMNLYDCIATGDERGLLQVVLDSTTLGSILLQMTDEEITGSRGLARQSVKRGSFYRKIRSAMKALGDYAVIKSWMAEKVEDEAPPEATDEYMQLQMQTKTKNFIVSAAAYCVASYVLGLGDR